MMDYKQWRGRSMMGYDLPRGFCQPVRSIKRARHNTKLKKKNVAQVSMNEITFFMRMCAIYMFSYC